MIRLLPKVFGRRLVYGLMYYLVLVALLVGCKDSSPPPQSELANKNAPQPPVRLLVIDDPELARTIERQWTAHGENPLTIRQVTLDEFLKSRLRRLGSDVVIYPTTLMGELASRGWLEPLEQDDLNEPGFEYRDIWEALRLHETKWGGRPLAVPLGSPALILCYRQDIFQQLNLSPPTTWAEYQELVARLSTYTPTSEGSTTPPSEWKGTYEPFGAGWGGELLLARAASYARHPSQFSTLFDYSNMRPLVDGAPFVRALEELIAAARTSSNSALDWQSARKVQDPAFVCARLVQGHCAMAITWPSDVAAGEVNPVPVALAFAPLPGGTDVYNFRTSQWENRSAPKDPGVPLLGISGRLASATKECRNLGASVRLLQFLSGPELSASLASASKHTTLFRESHLPHADEWLGSGFDSDSAQRYAQTMKQILNQSTNLVTLRIPARHRYMAILDQAVEDALSGKKTPQECLSAVATQWDTLTNELGREAQRQAYVQSIGLEL